MLAGGGASEVSVTSIGAPYGQETVTEKSDAANVVSVVSCVGEMRESAAAVGMVGLLLCGAGVRTVAPVDGG